MSLDLGGVRGWSRASPETYSVMVILTDGDANSTWEWETSFGFRSVAIAGGRIEEARSILLDLLARRWDARLGDDHAEARELLGTIENGAGAR